MSSVDIGEALSHVGQFGEYVDENGKYGATFTLNPPRSEGEIEFDPTVGDIRYGRYKPLNSFYRLGEYGWVIPGGMTLPQTAQILSEGDKEKIDALFVKFYSDPGALSILRDSLLSCDSIKQWDRLLEECFEAYERCRYLITIPALLTVLEGVISKDNPRTLSKSVRDNLLSAKLKQAGSNYYETIHWQTIGIFLDQLYAQSDFNGPEPPGLNRHWILHGRDIPDWVQADSLRLFLAIETVGW
jgi:hypothetical protein